MKRVLCLALVCVLLFQTFALPAQASAIGTGLLIGASAVSVVAASLVALGVMPGIGTDFDTIVSNAVSHLSSLGFGDGTTIPILKYMGSGGGIKYALQSSAMLALRSWIFDSNVVSLPSLGTSFSGSVNGFSYSLTPTYGSFFPLVCYLFSDTGSFFGGIVCFSDSLFKVQINGSTYSSSVGSSGCHYLGYESFNPLNSVSGFYSYSLGFGSSWNDYFSAISALDFSSLSFTDFDVSLGDVAPQDEELSAAYPNWAVDSVQVDPDPDDPDDEPDLYIPVTLLPTYDETKSQTQDQAQTGDSTLETDNDGTSVDISGDVGGSITPDGGGSGDLPGGEGSVTVDDLTTMFAWIAVRIDEAVQSLFPDLQVIKTYLKTIAQWHETENVKYDSMLSYFSGWDADIDTMLTTVSNIDLNLTTLVDLAATSSDTLAAIAADVQDIRDVIADPLDADINEEEQDNKNAFLNSFSKKSQAKSIGDLSGLSDGFTDWFSLDVDPGLLFDQVDTGFADWFTSETAQAISVGGGAAAAGISLMDDDPYVEPDTPYLDAWDQEVQDILSGGD